MLAVRFSSAVFFLLALGSSSVIANSDDIDKADRTFGECIEDFKQLAQTRGVSPQIIDRGLGNVKQQKQVLTYDKRQPEFVQTFPDYLNKRVTKWRIDKGKEKLAEHRTLLAKLSREYGVPAHYLVAFWGLETNFGHYKGKMPIIASIATLACDPRRTDYFTQELIVALQLMEREDLPVAKMQGSWAGAMGHTQFMPSAYKAYAVDGDGDGKIDLWDSEQDALASAANFLNSLGWETGFIWGREVILPADFDYRVAGKNQLQPLSFWSQHNVTKANGSLLPSRGEATADLEAALIIPTGANGPSFLVYQNFDVIMRWNNSESYALAVGYLADRIVGKPPWSVALPSLDNYLASDMVSLQSHLNQLGYDVGKADGILGPATRNGIRAFQHSKGMVADGYPSVLIFDEVRQAIDAM